MAKLSFDYFKDKEKFLQIKREFLFNDYRFDNAEAHISEVDIKLDDITKIIKKIDDEPEISTLNFYNDYCPNLIKAISEKHKKKELYS